MLQTVWDSDNNWLRYSIIGSKILNMLEFTSQSIACEIPASQQLRNAPSQVCSIAVCGWVLNSTRRHSHFLNSTCNIGLIKMARKNSDTTYGISQIRHVTWLLFMSHVASKMLRDMRHDHFLNLTCDIGDPPSRAPVYGPGGSHHVCF